MLMMTEKNKNIPEDEHGYWGGFSPTRKGRYENQNLTKRHADGRARIYPARKANSTYQSTIEQKDIIEDDESGHSKEVTDLRIGSVDFAQKKNDLLILSDSRTDSQMEPSPIVGNASRFASKHGRAISHIMNEQSIKLVKPVTGATTEDNVSQRSKEAMSFGKKSQQQVTFQTASEQNLHRIQKSNENSSEREENEMSKPYWERKNF